MKLYEGVLAPIFGWLLGEPVGGTFDCEINFSPTEPSSLRLRRRLSMGNYNYSLVGIVLFLASMPLFAILYFTGFHTLAAICDTVIFASAMIFLLLGDRSKS